jgi:hypothetical protein
LTDAVVAATVADFFVLAAMLFETFVFLEVIEALCAFMVHFVPSEQVAPSALAVLPVQQELPLFVPFWAASLSLAKATTLVVNARHTTTATTEINLFFIRFSLRWWMR